MNRYLLVLTGEQPGAASAGTLGALTGSLSGWVSALRRWRLLDGVAVGAGGAVRGAVVVTATDLAAARRVASSCPASVVVLALRDASG